jgi:hypothetical protein
MASSLELRGGGAEVPGGQRRALDEESVEILAPDAVADKS